MEKLNLVYYDFYQAILTLFILILGLIVCILVGAKKSSDIKYISLIYGWHTFYSCFYWYYSLSNPGDSITYYIKTFDLDLNFYPGTRFTESLVLIVTRIFDSNYLNTNLIFNIFGCLGLVLIYLTLKKFFFVLNKYWFFILLIPSMSFWSAGLGKDSISFFATGLFLYAVTTGKRPTLLTLIAVFSMFMVRPHIALMMLVSYLLYYFIKAKIHLVLKLFTLPIIAAGVIIALSFVQQYVGLEDTSLSSVSDYVDQRQGYNQRGGSSLDIASMSYPMQMFTYIFRPLPFEAHSAVALISSLENTILLLLFVYILIKSRFNFRPFIENKNLWLLTYVFLTCTILAITTANLGIATRQKWMFMPVLLYLLIYSFHDYKLNKSRIYQ